MCCVIVLYLVCTACGGSSSPPAETPLDVSPRPAVTDQPPTPTAVRSDADGATGEGTGKNVWEAIPDAPHGQCCESDDECGPITCEPWEYASDGCPTVCTYSCEPGDTCPALGGTLDPPPPCPDSGLCPVGAPWW